jgi:hypothetical protein
LERHRLVAEHLHQVAATLLQQLQPRREALEVLAAREDAKGGSGVEAAVGLWSEMSARGSVGHEGCCVSIVGYISESRSWKLLEPGCE